MELNQQGIEVDVSSNNDKRIHKLFLTLEESKHLALGDEVEVIIKKQGEIKDGE